MEWTSTTYISWLVDAGFVVLYVLLFFFAKWLKGFFASYRLDEQLTEYDNNAVSVSVAGYFMGVTAIFVGSMGGDSVGIMEDYLSVTGYSMAGVLLLNLARLLNERLILTKFSVEKEIIRDQNPGTGVIEAAIYLATGLIIGGAVSGSGGGPLTALVFFAIGQVCLILFGLLYERLTPYSVHDEIEKDNLAAGLGFAGGIISIGIILMHAVSGDFQGWAEDLMAVGMDVVIIFVYLAGVRLIFDRLVLRNSNLTIEIVEDKNIGAGLLEMVVAICFSVVLVFIL